MIFHLICACFILSTSAQRYAERNVPPADTFPSSDTTYDGNEDDYDGYGFEYDKDDDVYKWNVEDFPHPVTTPRFCHRLKPSNVCDPDQVLEREQADVLDRFIQKLSRETPCICPTCGSEDGGIVVGIALLKNLFLPNNVHPAKAIRYFAETLRFRWNLGRCDNDILIVVATTDRLSYTDVGKTTSNYLSIHEAHRIYLENKAKFSASNFSEGLLDILKGYYRYTEDMRDVLSKKKEHEVDITMISGIIVGVVVLLGIFLFVGFLIYRRYRIKKDSESDDDENPKKVRGETVSSSWKKKDIKVLFGSDNHKASKTKYEKCGTDENDAKGGADDEEVIDFTLATPDDTSFPNETQLTNVTAESEALEQDLTVAAEGIVRTFPQSDQKVTTTDM